VTIQHDARKSGCDCRVLGIVGKLGGYACSWKLGDRQFWDNSLRPYLDPLACPDVESPEDMRGVILQQKRRAFRGSLFRTAVDGGQNAPGLSMMNSPPFLTKDLSHHIIVLCVSP
jgi:hypothetical protein